MSEPNIQLMERLFPSPRRHLVAAAAGGVVQQAQLQPPHPALQPATQQYVPVTMVEQATGRQMLATVQTSWPTTSRQTMALVPSWQQLTAPGPGATTATVDNLLQPLFAASADDWRRPLIVDSTLSAAGGLRLQTFLFFSYVHNKNISMIPQWTLLHK